MTPAPASAARRVASIALVVLGVGCLVTGAVMNWVDAHGFDTAQVVETTNDMMEEPAIRELVRFELVQRIVGAVDPVVAPFVDPAVVAVIDDPRFAAVLGDAVRAAHTTLVAGDTEAIRFSLASVVPIVKEQLDAVDPSIFPQIPDLEPTLEYTLAERSELPMIWDAVDRFHRAAAALLVLGFVLVALALVVGPSRWALLILVGLSVLLISMTSRLAIGRVHTTIEDRIDQPVARDGALEVANLFTAPLERRLLVLAVLGAMAAVAGVVVRLVRPSGLNRSRTR